MVQMLEILYWNFINTAAEATLVASSSIDKLHVRTHVGLTAVAADWSSLTVIYNVQRSLIFGHGSEGFDNGCQRHFALLCKVSSAREGICCAPHESWAGIPLILYCEICGDQWRHLAPNVCDIHLAPSLNLVIFNHLRRAWNRVWVQLLLRRACHLGWSSREASWESACLWPCHLWSCHLCTIRACNWAPWLLLIALGSKWWLMDTWSRRARHSHRWS